MPNDYAPPNNDDDTPTSVRINSLPPDSQICTPVMVERARRKDVDAEFGKRLTAIEKRVNLVLAALAFMVAAASAEYAGIIGKNAEHTVWSHAIFDGVKYALMGNQK